MLFFPVRKRSEAKLEGKLWVDEEEAKVQRERMPATLRVEPNQLRDDVLSVYQHYADSIPGFMTDADNERRSKLAVLRQRQLQEQQQQAMRAGAPGPRVGPVSQEPKEEDFVLVRKRKNTWRTDFEPPANLVNITCCNSISRFMMGVFSIDL